MLVKGAPQRQSGLQSEAWCIITMLVKAILCFDFITPHNYRYTPHLKDVYLFLEILDPDSYPKERWVIMDKSARGDIQSSCLTQIGIGEVRPPCNIYVCMHSRSKPRVHWEFFQHCTRQWFFTIMQSYAIMMSWHGNVFRVTDPLSGFPLVTGRFSLNRPETLALVFCWMLVETNCWRNSRIAVISDAMSLMWRRCYPLKPLSIPFSKFVVNDIGNMWLRPFEKNIWHDWEHMLKMSFQGGF